MCAQPQSIKILDRFNNYPKNELGGETGGFYDKGSVQTEILTDNDAFEKEGKTLVIHYNVTNTNSFSGYYSKLQNVNLTNYNYLSFWIKGSISKEYLQVQLKNDKNETAKVAIWNYLVGGPTNEWQKVVIPMDAFWNLSARNRMAEFVIVFENYQASENGSPLTSTVYIDDIVFGTFFPGYLKIDDFSDKIKSNAVGGNTGEFSQSGTAGLYTSVINCNEYFESPCCLEINYDNSEDSEFGGVFFILGGGEDGWTKISKNISEYDYFTLAVKAKSSSLNPGNFDVELKSAIQTYRATVDNITTSFQEKPIYFNKFSPINPQQIQEMAFVFVRNVQQKLIGTIYIDDIELRKIGSKESELLKPNKPAYILFNNQQLNEFDCINFENSFNLATIYTTDASLLESIRLEYENQNQWYVRERKYINNNSSVSWLINASDLPEKNIINLRIIAQNTNGLDSDYFNFKVSPNNNCAVKSDIYQVENMKLSQNYPNPFNSETLINFQLNKQSKVRLDIYDTLGRKIRTLLNNHEKTGNYSVSWDSKNDSGEKVAAGIYIYKLVTDSFSDMKKMMLIQ